MIVLNKVSKSFGDVKAVNQVSLEIPDMSSLVILGPSGSGKTTLLRLIAGLELPDSGEIYLNGILACKSNWAMEPHRRGLGFVFQASALWPHMTVGQNIMFGLHGISASEAQKRLKEILESISLTGFASRYPHQISGGEARRVALARTLAPRPKIILMDEPLTNLDQDLKSSLLAFIKKWTIDTKATLIYVTHDAGEAGEISDNVLTLRNGSLEP
jgi:ABC-type Fe3+/spermidine/putrescine transport system ATPase subunit